MAKKFAVLVVTCLILCLFLPSVKASVGEIDKTAIVSKVIDGDTFVLDSGETVRFADVNTPEVDESGYLEAKNYVANLVEGKTVYLDIDDISRTDTYGRLVCVVYFDYNSTHYENLNKALLVNNYAVNYDFDNNEFSPTSWSLYVSKTVIPEFPIVTITVLAIVLISLIALKTPMR